MSLSDREHYQARTKRLREFGFNVNSTRIKIIFFFPSPCVEGEETHNDEIQIEKNGYELGKMWNNVKSKLGVCSKSYQQGIECKSHSWQWVGTTDVVLNVFVDHAAASL